ncbi:cellulase N-terminal Ig-like domain-containing protein, partial [Streptomyces niveus]|uniref:cellulase N-terminal Ig-like domain-containing protein n=1 Tax=Streptomyces niveus TaxID=193462 RepID=UPI00342C5757
MRTSLFLPLSLALVVAAVPAEPRPGPGSAPDGAGPVLVNQIGYATGADKIATVVASDLTDCAMSSTLGVTI